MMKFVPLVIATAILVGCRTHSITPDESWADYGRYYHVIGVVENAPSNLPEIRSVKSAQVEPMVEALRNQGYVPLGTLTLEDGTDITYPAVLALAQKVNASIAVWSALTTLDKNTALPNPDMGIVGVDLVQHAHSAANRRDQTIGEQMTIRKHLIWMMGKK